MSTQSTKDLYNVVLISQHAATKIILRNVSLETAQAVCHDPETSSRTCTTKRGKAMTKRIGEWFYGFQRA